MKEKIKKIFIVIFYIFVWFLFIASLSLVYWFLSGGYQEVKKWGLFLLGILTPFFSGYLLRNHFRFLGRMLKKIYLSIPSIIIMVKKINKISLPATILIVGVILGGFYYMSQINKQNSIERQQQLELEAERKKTEEQLKQKECESLSDGVKKRWNNVMGVTYDGGLWKECVVTYTDTETGEVEVSPLRFMQDVE